MQLYEILIPNFDHLGKEFPEELRKKFLLETSDIAGGVTVLGNSAAVFGVWKNPEGEMEIDSSGIIRVACSTEEQLKRICQLAALTFNQTAIMAYSVSSEVHFYGKPLH